MEMDGTTDSDMPMMTADLPEPISSSAAAATMDVEPTVDAPIMDGVASAEMEEKPTPRLMITQMVSSKWNDWLPF